MTSKPVVVEKAKVKTDQLLTNVNKLSEPSTISKEKIELIELPKDSILIYSSCHLCFLCWHVQITR